MNSFLKNWPGSLRVRPIRYGFSRSSRSTIRKRSNCQRRYSRRRGAMSDVPLTSVTPDVLIVGAGPIGLTLANDLLRRGIHIRLIDSTEHAAQQTKAVGIQARTLELLAKMGVAQTAIERGLIATLFSIYSDGKRLIHIDFGKYLLDSPYA